MNCPIAAPRSNALPIRRPGDCRHILRVTTIHGDFVPIQKAPDLGRLIHASRSEIPAIRRPGDGIDHRGMALIGHKFVLIDNIPDLDGLVPRSKSDISAIRRPGDCPDLISMPPIDTESRSYWLYGYCWL